MLDIGNLSLLNSNYAATIRLQREFIGTRSCPPLENARVPLKSQLPNLIGNGEA